MGKALASDSPSLLASLSLALFTLLSLLLKAPTPWATDEREGGEGCTEEGEEGLREDDEDEVLDDEEDDDDLLEELEALGGLEEQDEGHMAGV